MKEKFFSVLVSLIFIPIAALSQYVGMLIGELWWYIWKNLPFVFMGEFIGALVIGLISGSIAGYASSFCIQKIYKNFNINFVLIIPVLLILVASIGDVSVYIRDKESFVGLLQQLVREISTIYIFYYCLKNKIIKIS